MPDLAERIDRRRLERLPDHEVAARVAAGDTALFELIMRRYNRRLFRIARGILGDDAEAEDAVQDGYTRAYLKLAQFRGPSGFASWICQIVVNAALARRNRGGGTSAEAGKSSPGDVADREETSLSAPEEALHDVQLSRLLERAIDKLPEAYRTTFVLRELEQLSVNETAKCLGIEDATVKSRVHRARRLLQKRLQGALDEALSGVFGFGGARCDRLVTAVFECITSLAASPCNSHRSNQEGEA